MTHKLILTKVFTEIRMTPSILYDDLSKRNVLVKTYQENFGEPQHDKTEKIEVRDINNKTAISFFSNRIVVDTDQFNNYKHLEQVARQAINDYAEIFEINTFSRIGIRFYYGLTFDSLKNAKELIRSTFFQVLDKNALVNLGALENEQVFMGFNDNGQSYSVGIYPSTLSTFEGSETGTTQSSYNFITFDIDIFKVGKLKTKDCIKVIEDAEAQALTKVKNIICLMGVSLNDS